MQKKKIYYKKIKYEILRKKKMKIKQIVINYKRSLNVIGRANGISMISINLLIFRCLRSMAMTTIPKLYCDSFFIAVKTPFAVLRLRFCLQTNKHTNRGNQLLYKVVQSYSFQPFIPLASIFFNKGTCCETER